MYVARKMHGVAGSAFRRTDSYAVEDSATVWEEGTQTFLAAKAAQIHSINACASLHHNDHMSRTWASWG